MLSTGFKVKIVKKKKSIKKSKFYKEILKLNIKKTSNPIKKKKKKQKDPKSHLTKEDIWLTNKYMKTY